jgi:hypothetical protein
MATGTFSNNTAQNLTADVTWSSSNAAAATIDGSGVAPMWAAAAVRFTSGFSLEQHRTCATADHGFLEERRPT